MAFLYSVKDEVLAGLASALATTGPAVPWPPRRQQAVEHEVWND